MEDRNTPTKNNSKIQKLKKLSEISHISEAKETFCYTSKSFNFDSNLNFISSENTSKSVKVYIQI